MEHSRLGLLGGTFDPPHIGHLVAAECARVSLGLQAVQLVVAGNPWMKSDFSDPEHRVRMAELATTGDPNLLVNRSEVDRSGLTYTVDTLQELVADNPGTEFFFLLGTDAASKLPEWQEVDKALELATFVALTRPGYSLERDDPLVDRIEEVEMPEIGISSSDLRRRFAVGAAVRYLLPLEVEGYVRDNGLYGASGEPVGS